MQIGPNRPNLSDPALAKEELLSLPGNESFVRFIDQHAKTRETFWSSDSLIQIDESMIPESLSAAFYFAKRGDIRDIRASLSESMIGEDSIWNFKMEFTLNRQFEYTILMTNIPELVSVFLTKDPDGNTIQTNTDNWAAIELLIALYSQGTSQKEDGEEDASALINSFKSKSQNVPITSAIFRNILEEFAKINGLTQSTITADLPYPDGDKATRVDLKRNGASTTVSLNVGYKVDGQTSPIGAASLVINGLNGSPQAQFVEVRDSSAYTTIDDYLTRLDAKTLDGATLTSTVLTEYKDLPEKESELNKQNQPNPEFDRVVLICVAALIKSAGLEDIPNSSRIEPGATGEIIEPGDSNEPAYEDPLADE